MKPILPFNYLRLGQTLKYNVSVLMTNDPHEMVPRTDSRGHAVVENNGDSFIKVLNITGNRDTDIRKRTDEKIGIFRRRTVLSSDQQTMSFHE